MLKQHKHHGSDTIFHYGQIYLIKRKLPNHQSEELFSKTSGMQMEEPGRLQSMGSLSDFIFTFHFHALEKEMATHSGVLAWRIPGTGSLVGCRLWVTQSRTRLKQLSSSNSSSSSTKLMSEIAKFKPGFYIYQVLDLGQISQFLRFNCIICETTGNFYHMELQKENMEKVPDIANINSLFVSLHLFSE